MIKSVYLSNGQGQDLGNLIAKGGEGSVFALADPKFQHLVVKLYDPARLAEPTARRLRRKVELLAKLPIRAREELCWPREPLYDKHGSWVGYVMHRASGCSIENYCHPLKARKTSPDWDRADACALARQFVHAVSALHAQNILVGDINTGNVMFDGATGRLWLIDCDSCQIKIGGETFLCPVGVGAFTAPELQGVPFDVTPRTEQAERFAVAVMLYKILMLGSHPFSFCGGSGRNGGSEVADEATNIRNGNCPLGTGTGLRLPKGLWFNRWSHLPYIVKNAFIKTFRDGHANPDVRTTLAAWQDALKQYAWCLTKGHASADFFPDAPKSRAAGEAWAKRA